MKGGDKKMTVKNIIRSWKDPEYRATLSKMERSLLPKHPSGLIELSDEDLDFAGAGEHTANVPSCIAGCPLPPPDL
jgi:mersacidin/lichenicidin family type 2 lantibiotic